MWKKPPGYNLKYQRRYRQRLKAKGLTVDGKIPRWPPYESLAGWSDEDVKKRKRWRAKCWQRRKRAEYRVADAKQSGPLKSARIDLGVTLLHRRARWGEPKTLEEIAAWAGCHIEAIRKEEQRALRKLRGLLHDYSEAADSSLPLPTM